MFRWDYDEPLLVRSFPVRHCALDTTGDPVRVCTNPAAENVIDPGGQLTAIVHAFAAREIPSIEKGPSPAEADA